MPSGRATAMVAFIVVITVVQIAVEDVVVFLGATRSGSPVLSSPTLMIAVPFVLFLLLAGVLYAWAIGTDDTLR